MDALPRTTSATVVCWVCLGCESLRDTVQTLAAHRPHAIVVRTGPRPLRRLLQADMRTALEGLEIT